jgi:uracil-DNA glycosylase family 4
MFWMQNAFDQLLDATILHLENLKTRGARFVSVSPKSLVAVSQISSRSARPNPLAPRPANRPTVEQRPAGPSSVSTIPERSELRSEPSLLPTTFPPPSTIAPALVSLNPEAKAAAFADLHRRVMPCVKCPHLATARKNVVFGVGDINAQLMFVGEAPGVDEDAQGEPFVGKAGQLLTKIIQTMGLSRGSVYIANILKCRPDTPGQASGNRKPTPEEMQTCISYLHEQIDLIGPKVIVALGATAVEGLLGKTIGITKLRGQWRTYRGTPLMPTYHPAYLLRNQALSEKRRVWEDMLQVMERLGLPINEKQRNYFL